MLKNAGDCQSLSTVDRSVYQLLIFHPYIFKFSDTQILRVVVIGNLKTLHFLSDAHVVSSVDGVAVFCGAELGADLMRGDASRVRTGYRKVAGTKTLRV